MLRVFAKFDDEERALKAAGALIDHGVGAEEFDLVGSPQLKERLDGLTTTTAADAVRGASQGGTAGLALGALAGLASLFIPGYGLVIGSGALATAAAAALGTGAAGVRVYRQEGEGRNPPLDPSLVRGELLVGRCQAGGPA